MGRDMRSGRCVASTISSLVAIMAATKRPLKITFKRKQNPLHAKPEVISKLKSPTKHAPKPEVKSKLKSPAKAKPSPSTAILFQESDKAAPPPANPKPKAPKLKASDVTKFDQGDGSGSEEGDGSGSEEEGDEEEDEKEGDDEEDEEEGDEEEDKEEGDEEEDEEECDEEEDEENGDEEEDEGEDEEDAIVKDEEYEEEEENVSEEEEEEEEDVKVKGNKRGRKGKGEVVMSKGKKIKVEDKEVEEKKRKKDSEPSSSEDEKPLKKKTKGGKKGKGPNAKVNMKRFMQDLGFSALHSVNIDKLPNHLARFVVRAFDNKTYNFYLKTGVVHVTAEKVHEILGLPIGGISLYDLPERQEDDEFVQLWLSQFARKKNKQIFATDIAEKLVRSTRVDFMFKVNFLMLFANVMGKADTMRAFVNILVFRRIREDTNITGVDWCDFIHRCLEISHEPNTVSGFYNGPLCFLISTKNMSTRHDLKIEDDAFGKLEFYGEWSENETIEVEGFCEYASVLPHTDKKKSFQAYPRRRLKLKLSNKEFLTDDNVKQLFEQYKGFFKETVLLKEVKAQKAPQNVKTKPAAVNTKEAAEKPKPAKNVKELAEKPKEPAEKAQKVPQNVKPKSAVVKPKEAAEKPKPVAENVKELAGKPKESAKNVKELAEKPKEPAEKAQKAPQNKKPKPAAVKTKEAAEKPKPAENVKELAEKPKEPAGDDYQVVRAATVMKAEDRKEFELESFTQWIEGNIEVRETSLIEKPEGSCMA
ncbi:hypothetical protein Tco_0796410 [Tanacetum coccineum]